MIRERPGEKNDREYVKSNLDSDMPIHDKEEYDKNYERAFGLFVPSWYKDTFEETGIPLSEALEKIKLKDDGCSCPKWYKTGAWRSAEYKYRGEEWTCKKHGFIKLGCNKIS